MNSFIRDPAELSISEDDYWFVEELSADMFCPVTKGLLLQPHLTACCGNHLSEEAALRIKKDKGACPLCKEEKLVTMLDKNTQRKTKKVPVFCKNRGCQWQGELAAYHQHTLSCSGAQEITIPSTMYDVLKEDDIFEIIEVLWDARGKWRTIGLGLKISRSDLDIIKQNDADVDDQFRSMLLKWLQNGEECTWEALCWVLSKRSVGYHTLAREIEQKYTSKLAQVPSQPSPQTEPLSCKGAGDNETSVRSGEKERVMQATPMELPLPTDPDQVLKTKFDVTAENETTKDQLTQTTFQPLAAIDTPSTATVSTPVCSTATPIDSSEDMNVETSSETTTAPRELALRKDIKLRDYQEELARPGLQGKNYILISPTGTGKTLVAGFVIVHHLNKMLSEGRRGKVAFVTPTQQLTFQQKQKLYEYIQGIGVVDITGASDIPMQSLVQSDQLDVIVCTAGKLRRELMTKTVAITDFSLIVADECHHAGRPSNYSDIMEFYIRLKLAGKSVQLPQVLGMTASPGAGRGKASMISTLDHQISLCATLDATTGIIAVGTDTKEFKRLHSSPTSRLEIGDERDPRDPFVLCVNSTMETLEQFIGSDIPLLGRGSTKYVAWLQNEKEAAEDREEDERKRISVLDRLNVYSLCLLTYRDFRYEDAMSGLEEIEEFQDQSSFERFLYEIHKGLLEKLSGLPKTPNPLLVKMESILLDQFTRCPNSRGIFFVQAVKHTRYATAWIKSSPALSRIIRPTPITGYSRGGMEKSEQLRVLEGFRRDSYNLLASTSVLEEGLDVPECNFVIRYQNVSNEIAQVQAKGRARAEDSRVYTIVSSNSNKDYWYLIQEEKLRMVEASVAALQGKDMEQLIVPKQKSFIEERERKAQQQMRNLRSRWPEPEKVEVRCKKCNVFACYGSDLFAYNLSGSESHYVVPSETFSSKYNKRTHDKPAVSDNFIKPHRIYCRSPNCRSQWGVIALWNDTGFKFPVLKCEKFLFKCGHETRRFKKWKDIWFEIKGIQDWAEFEDDEVKEPIATSDSGTV